MKKRLLALVMSLTLALSLLPVTAGAYDTFTGSGTYYLAALTETEPYYTVIPDFATLSKEPLTPGRGLTMPAAVDSFDDLYAVFSNPENYETFKTNYSANQTGTESIIKNTTNLALVIHNAATPGPNSVTVSEDFVVADRSAQLAFQNYNTTVTMEFAEGKTIKVHDGGSLLIQNTHTAIPNRDEDMQLKIVLTEPIQVGNGGALYFEPRADITPATLEYDPDYATDVIVAPAGKSAIQVNGGDVRISRFDVVRNEADTSSEPLIDVSGGTLTLNDGALPKVLPQENGMPDYEQISFNPDGNFVTTIKNGDSSAPIVRVANGATANIEGGTLTGSGDTPLVVVENGATLNLSGEFTEIQTTSTTQPAITVAQGGTLVYKDSDATVTSSNNTQAIDLAQGAKVTKGGITITAGEGDNYVDNNGIAVFSAGATTGEETVPMNAAVLLSDGTLIEGSETDAPEVSTDEEGKTIVTVPAGGSVTTTDGQTTSMPNGGSVDSAGTVTVTPDPTPTPTPDDDGPAIDVPDTYPITVPDTANGSVDTSYSNASKGSVITVTVAPDEGFIVGSVSVTGEDGAVEVKRVNSTTYSFVMPESAVTVSVNFVSGSAGFVDVPAGAWYSDAVAYVYANGLMQGTSATTFEPDAGLTRSMVWAVLARMDGETVSGTGWQSVARAWAVRSGVSDGTDPNGLITREQLVTMLWRFAGEPTTDATLSGYSDADSVNAWATTAMAWAIDNGIITGVTDTTLVPQGTATRAQCAAILMRYVENV